MFVTKIRHNFNAVVQQFVIIIAFIIGIGSKNGVLGGDKKVYYDNLGGGKPPPQAPLPTSAITTRRLNYRYHRPLRAGHYGRLCRWCRW